MTIYGYIRVSTRDQNPERQYQALQEYGVQYRNVYLDMMSGKDFARPQYLKLLHKMRAGDLLIIKSIDRLGRNYDEILEQWRLLTKEKQINIEVIDMPLLNYRTLEKMEIMQMKNDIKVETNLKPSEILSLMDIYCSEWCHRDSSMWKQLYVYYLRVFVIMLLPYISPMNLDLPDGLPEQFFIIVGMILSVVVAFIAWTYASRMRIVRNAYVTAMKQLPINLQQKIENEQKYHGAKKIFKKMWISVMICIITSIAQIVFGVLLLMNIK